MADFHKSPPVETWPDDEISQHSTPEEMLDSRTKRTLDASEDSAKTATATFMMLNETRKDLSDEIKAHSAADLQVQTEIREQLSGVGERIDGLGSRIDAVGVRVDGTLAAIVETFQKTQTVTMTARVEVDKHAQMANIDDVKDAKKYKRDLVLKVVAILTPIIGTVATALTLLASRC